MSEVSKVPYRGLVQSASWTKNSILRELVRKSLHLSIALVPALCSVSGIASSMLLLFAGMVCYLAMETARMHGIRVPVVSKITELAMRDRDEDRLVLGPVTLAAGALLSLMVLPAQAAFVGIYALAFGDGLASLAGKAFGTIRIPHTGGKSLEGSLACFGGIIAGLSLFMPGMNPVTMIVIAAGATLLELLPLRDMDNIVLPIGAGLIALALM